MGDAYNCRTHSPKTQLLLAMIVEVDARSGFCFGVVKAIETAERLLADAHELYCIGDIVHNGQEVDRLRQLGMSVVDTDSLPQLTGKHVLIRAHGEPPSTYALAQTHGVMLTDATCPVVLRLQQRVKHAWEHIRNQGGTVIIYGKKGHAEVIGIVGQTQGEAVVVEQPADLHGITLNAPLELFSQTTMEPQQYQQLANVLRTMLPPDAQLTVHDTICRQVANRRSELAQFAAMHDVLIFVGGRKSSNAKTLFTTCQQANSRSHFVASPNDLQPNWFANAQRVGVCGATSTPQWLMEAVAKRVHEL